MSIESNHTPSPREKFYSEIITPLELSPHVARALWCVDRADFVPSEGLPDAYEDKVVIIKDGSTVSQPSLVAMMTEALDVRPIDHVLEIGTASGYQAAILSHLAARVDTIENDAILSSQADARLKALGYSNINVFQGDGAKGIPDSVHYDRVIFTAAIKSVPKPILEQLEIGGKVLAPTGIDPRECKLTLVTKKSDRTFITEKLGDCHFVPLVSDVPGAWSEKDLLDLQKRDVIRQRDWVKSWLSEGWSENGISYEDGLKFLASSLAKTLVVPDDRIDEMQALDTVSVVLRAIKQPRL